MVSGLAPNASAWCSFAWCSFRFPRLVEADLPAGVGDVSFAVSLATCEPFAAPVSAMLDALVGDGTKRSSHP